MGGGKKKQINPQFRAFGDGVWFASKDFRFLFLAWNQFRERVIFEQVKEFEKLQERDPAMTSLFRLIRNQTFPLFRIILQPPEREIILGRF